MHTLKTTSPKGKGLLERFKALKVGQPCLFPSLLPSLSGSPIQAVLIDFQDNEWEFKLFWRGVEIGAAEAHVVKDQIEFEVL